MSELVIFTFWFNFDHGRKIHFVLYSTFSGPLYITDSKYIEAKTHHYLKVSRKCTKVVMFAHKFVFVK